MPIIGAIAGLTTVAAAAIAALITKALARKTTYQAEAIDSVPVRRMGFYEKYVKRAIDILCAAGAIVVFSPIYIVVAVLVRCKLGSPVLFTQDRPGLVDCRGKETVFKMYKFRSMTDERDENGNLLPDEVRLTKFGAWLRNTSLDELPEAFNILNGTMSVIGPRPQLVRDMTFMTKEQRARHTAKPGLSGLAQVNGRNAISWEDKINWDLRYIQKVSFFTDVKIVLDTVKKAFIKQEGITQDDMATSEDLGDYLLRTEKITPEQYKEKQLLAKMILNGQSCGKKEGTPENKYSVLMSVYAKEDADNFRTALNAMLSQTYAPDEILLVEDGALTQELYAVIQDVKQSHPGVITSVVNEQNLGLGPALQKGLEATRNELVARMDTDDIAVADRCEKQLRFLNENPDIAIVGGQIEEFIGEQTNIVGKREVPTQDPQLKAYLRKRCPFNHMTVMFRKSDVLEVGNYQAWFWNEDYYLWIRLALAGKKFANLPETLVFVRTGADMYRRRGGMKYYRSEKELQKLMLSTGLIGYPRYLINVVQRLVLQVLMPNWLRGIVFRIFARK